MTVLPQTSLNSGEITPLAYGRVDLAKYRSALEACRNMVVTPHGGVTRRPGTEYIATTKNESEEIRLIPFTFNTEQAYMIEAGPNYMRFYKDGGQIQTVDAETVLLLNMNGTQNSTTFTDSGATVHAITAGGNAVVDTAQKKFGTGSGVLHGVGDYLDVADHADFFFSTGSFTVDFWVRFSALPALGSRVSFIGTNDGNQRFVSFEIINTAGVYALIANRTNTANAWDDTITNTWSTPAINTWYHLAMVYDSASTVMKVYIDGVAQGVTGAAQTCRDSTADVRIGQDSQGTNLDGWLDEYRVSKGVARWTEDFSNNLPASQLPNGQAGGGGVAYEIATPYIEDDLASLQFIQSADTMYIVHPNYSPRKLTRTGHAAWTLTVISFTGTPTHWGIQSKAITGITAANPGVVTSVGHGLTNGDVVLITNVVGMTEVNGFTYTVANKAADTYELAGVNTTGFTAYASGGFWNENNTHPATVALHEERIFFSGEPNNPQTIDAGKSGDFEDLTTGVADDDGFQYTIAADQVNAIRWMVPDEKLLMGTSGGEWRLGGGGDIDDPITPTSIDIKQMSRNGAQALRPISIGTEYIYLQNIGKTIRTLSYKFEDNKYSGINLSILGEHLTKNDTIVRMSYQQQPYQIIWVVKDDGELIGLTYMLEHEVTGWHRHDTAATGLFEDVASIPGTSDDEVWFVVNRTINGSVTRYIERLKTFWTDGDEENAFYVDSGLTYSGASATIISGLDHLEDEEVTIWSNGAAVASKTVVGGSITLDAAATLAHIGICMISDTGTLRLDPGDGSFQGKEKTIYELVMRVFETIGYTYGKDSSSLDTKTQTSLTSDDDLLSFEGVFDTKGQVFIRKTDGGPLTILSIMPKFELVQE